MEDPDEVSSSEVEGRLYNIERVINKFKIVSSGSGTVLGGFGKLPDDYSQMVPSEKLKHLTSATNKFDLSGMGVDVAGSFDDGFKLS